MFKPKTKNFFEKDKTLILAYDQGFEHGPTDFNEKNINPEYVLNIARDGGFNGFASQVGIVKHHRKLLGKDVPFIVKLNAKDFLNNKDPLSLQHTSVEYAAKLGAKAVGYTLYLGSTHEQKMFKEFGYITERAHDLGMLSMCWVYPRGPRIENEMDTNTIAYGARIAMELGADVVKVKYNGDPEGLKWIVKVAGKAKVVVAGGSKEDDLSFLKMTREVIDAGASGLAIGRNIWQNDSPLILTTALKDVIFNNAKPEIALENAKKLLTKK